MGQQAEMDDRQAATAASATAAAAEDPENSAGGASSGSSGVAMGGELPQNVVAVGAMVRVQNLKSMTLMNGTEGRVQRWVPEKQRWTVELSDGTMFNVMEKNLEVVVPDIGGNRRRGGEERAQKTMRQPERPTEGEKRDHLAKGHSTYRCWCPDCVKSMKRDLPHVSRGEAPLDAVPEVSADYFFPRDNKGAPPIKCLAVKHRSSRGVKAFVVQRKGEDMPTTST